MLNNSPACSRGTLTLQVTYDVAGDMIATPDGADPIVYNLGAYVRRMDTS